MYRPLLILLILGGLLRLLTMVLYFPTALQWIDVVRFSRIGPWHSFFSDYYMPAGYAVFLKITHALSSDVALTVSVQHLLGLGGGVLVYGAIRRTQVPRWLALLPTAVLVLGGDQLYLEHIMMNDFLFMFLLTAGFCTAMYGLLPRPRLRVLALASLIFAVAGLTRQTGLAGLPVLGLCAFLARDGGLRPRFTALLCGVIPGVILVVAYAVAANAIGTYSGLTDMGGWNLYARVAPFADCRDFTPPSGTSKLCEMTPSGLRNGPFWYAWEQQSRGQSLLGLATPANGRLPGDFARAVVENQPLDYLHAIVKDFSRYADPNVGTIRAWAGEGPETVSFEQGQVDPTTSRSLQQNLAGYWTGLRPHLVGVQILDAYQSATRIIGGLWWALWALALFAIVAASRTARIGALMFGLTAFLLYLLPVMSLSWDWRYGVPAQYTLVASATFGAWTLLDRATRRRRSQQPQPLT